MSMMYKMLWIILLVPIYYACILCFQSGIENNLLPLSWAIVFLSMAIYAKIGFESFKK